MVKPVKGAKMLKGATKVATMAAMAGFFAIILDRHAAVEPGQLPVTESAPTLPPLRLITQHDDRFTLFPRTLWRADRQEPKNLVNSRTGNVDNGAIFALSRI